MKLFSAFAHYPRDEDTGTGKFREAIYGASSPPPAPSINARRCPEISTVSYDLSPIAREVSGLPVFHDAASTP
jgi:hypothetical protein